MMTYEVTGATLEQRRWLEGFGIVERVDRETLNVVVEDADADDISEWLEKKKLQYRSI